MRIVLLVALICVSGFGCNRAQNEVQSSDDAEQQSNGCYISKMRSVRFEKIGGRIVERRTEVDDQCFDTCPELQRMLMGGGSEEQLPIQP